MFLKPKRVRTKKNFIKVGKKEVPRKHIDQMNRQIVEACKKKEQQNTYHKGYNK